MSINTLQIKFIFLDDKIILDPRHCSYRNNIMNISFSTPTIIDILILNGKVNCSWIINNIRELWILRPKKSYKLPSKLCEMILTDLNTFVSYNITNYLIQWDEYILPRNILRVRQQVSLNVTCKNDPNGSLWSAPKVPDYSMFTMWYEISNPPLQEMMSTIS